MGTLDDRDGTQLGPEVTRRDFVNAALIGTGALLLGARCPAAAHDLGAEWDGYGGVGDYRASNGDTAAVTRAAHRIRDRAYDGALTDVVETGEHYDLVIVGGGFAGLGALLEHRRRHPRGTVLLLDNQAIFGGYAKSNAFDVGGVRVAAGQATMNFVMPETPEARTDACWDVLGLPDRFRFAEREGGDNGIVFGKATSSALYHGEQSASTGYFFRDPAAAGGGRWIKDIWRDDLRAAAFPPAYRDGLLTLRAHKRRGRPEAAEAARLDRLTFADWATKELGVDPAALAYITQGMCITGPQISAFGAQSLPGLDRFAPDSAGAALAERFMSFPGGNATLARSFVAAVVPAAFPGGRGFEAVANGPVDLTALDRDGAPARLRLRATVVRAEHEGDPQDARGVAVTYEHGGRLRRVRARGVVMAIGAWVAKHVVAGLPARHRTALDAFRYAPILIVNVALTNWRFLDRLGFSAARWFDGLGFFASIRQPMIVGDGPTPFHPDKPIAMTIYVPFPAPELPLAAQGPAGRARLFGTSYADYERQIVAQMQAMFAGGGFDARRDIAGIVLNRWGHAFVTPPPGFFFGTEDAPAPLAVAREPFGRIAFAQSGLEDWLGAAHAGRRAVGEVAAVA